MNVGPERIAGSFAGKPLIIVALTKVAMARVRELTLVGSVPTWFEHDIGGGLERVATTDPTWFAELEEQLRANVTR
jgi:hypothetical protein